MNKGSHCGYCDEDKKLHTVFKLSLMPTMQHVEMNKRHVEHIYERFAENIGSYLTMGQRVATLCIAS